MEKKKKTGVGWGFATGNTMLKLVTESTTLRQPRNKKSGKLKLEPKLKAQSR